MHCGGGAVGRHAEAMLVQALELERTSRAVLGGEALDVPGELPHEIAAGRPHRQGEHERVARILDGDLHMEEVPVRIGHGHAVAHGRDE